MLDNNLFVFDTTKGFARFIKLNFADRYSINSCTLRKNLDNYNLDHYKVAFVTINKYEEVVDFLHIKLKIGHVFAASSVPEVKLLLNEMPDIIFLDLDKIKKQTIEEIINNLKYIELNS